MPVARFLERHWQKRPLLIREAIPGFAPAITPEELAGLACDDEVESRLVFGLPGSDESQVLHGPFEPNVFGELPEKSWTLLVQEVDRWVPEVARLLDAFRFIPNWRIDDVMISYATADAGVGAHVDQYDVFLLQAGGRRRWSIGNAPVSTEKLVPDSELRLLADFEPDEQWVLEPGDMLYLPPGIPHDGVALEPGMTFSIGFRAPSRQEILGMFLSTALETTDPEERYRDPDLQPSDDAGEISAAALTRIREQLRSLVSDDDRFERWVGCFLTEPRRLRDEPEEPDTPRTIESELESGCVLRRATAPRFAHLKGADGRRRLFVGGREYDAAPEIEAFAVLLCGNRTLDAASLDPWLDTPRCLEILGDLRDRGYLVADPPASS
jgi:50S ribosomal protein L16 3-hydroxylase